MLIPPSHIFFIGPRKTGTTTIYEVFKAQGLRTPLSIKETFFFDLPEIDLSEYQRKYGLDPAIPFVEISPSYFTSVDARRHLCTHFPDAWIIITLRDPVRRSLSALSHAERIGQLDVNAERARDSFFNNKHVQNILRTSDFEPHVRAWAEAFPGRTIIMRQNVKDVFDPETIKQTAETCGIPFPADAMLAMRRNAARRSRSPALLKRAKIMMRGLDHLGLGGARRILKPLAAFLYRPAPPADQELASLVGEKLVDSIAYYDAQPYWSLR